MDEKKLLAAAKAKKKIKRAMINLDQEIWSRVDAIAKRNGISRTKFVEAVCLDALSSLEKKRPA